jgi:uncharacterized lipoprotein YehR (DUF1307 family)
MKPLVKLKSVACILAVFVSTFLAGCLQVEQTVNLKADGSGTIVVSTVMTKEAMQQISSLAALDPENKAKNPIDEMMSDEKAKQQAAQLGEGVKFVKAEKIKTDKGEGAKLTFSFTDITKVKMDVNLGDAAPTPKADAKPPVSFQFTKGSPSKLTMTMNQSAPEKKAETAAEDPNEAQGLAMAQQMMKGMRITMNLNVDGTLVATNATHKVGNKITLMDVPMDELFKDPKKFAASQKAGSFAEGMAIFKDIPGLKVETKPVVTVEIK